MRWSKFKNNDPRDIYDVISRLVFPAIKNMKHGHLPDFNEKGELMEIADDTQDGPRTRPPLPVHERDAMFLIPRPRCCKRSSPGYYWDDLYEHDIADLDMQGDLYEYMLGKAVHAGQNGQFRPQAHPGDDGGVIEAHPGRYHL